MGELGGLQGIGTGQSLEGATAAGRAARRAEGGAGVAMTQEETALPKDVLCPPYPRPRPQPCPIPPVPEPWPPGPSERRRAQALVDAVLDAPDRASQMRAYADFVQTVRSPFTSTSFLRATRDYLIERMATEWDPGKRQIMKAMLNEVNQALENRGEPQWPDWPYPPRPFPDPPGPRPWPPFPHPRPEPLRD